jgi:hypothetical protein
MLHISWNEENEMSLSRYSVEVNGIASELARMLTGNVKQAAYAMAQSQGDAIFQMTREEFEKALAFLSKTPNQREKAIAKLSDNDAAILIVRARYLGLAASRTIEIADDVSLIPGQGYRAAAQSAARTLFSTQPFPSLNSVLTGLEYDDTLDTDVVKSGGESAMDQYYRMRDGR